MKRFWAVLLTLVMLVNIVPLQVFAEEIGEEITNSVDAVVSESEPMAAESESMPTESEPMAAANEPMAVANGPVANGLLPELDTSDNYYWLPTDYITWKVEKPVDGRYEPVTSGETIPHGTQLQITATYSLPRTDVPEGEIYLKWRTPTELVLGDHHGSVEDGGTEIGLYTIEGGIVKHHLYADKFAQQGTINAKQTYTATATGTADGPLPVQVGSVDFLVGNPAELQLTKNAVLQPNKTNDGKYQVDYTLTVDGASHMTDLKLHDQFLSYIAEKAVYDRDSFELNKVSSGTPEPIDLNGKITFGANDRGDGYFDLDYGTLEREAQLVLTYSILVDPMGAGYQQNYVRNDVNATAKSGADSLEANKYASVVVESQSIQKNGTYHRDTNTISWEITLNPNALDTDGIDLNGMTVKDIYPGTANVVGTATIIAKGSAEWAINLTPEQTQALFTTGYTFDVNDWPKAEQCKGRMILSFSTAVSQAEIAAGEITNGATLSRGDQVLSTAEKTVDIRKGALGALEKVGEGVKDGEISWRLSGSFPFNLQKNENNAAITDTVGQRDLATDIEHYMLYSNLRQEIENGVLVLEKWNGTGFERTAKLPIAGTPGITYELNAYGMGDQSTTLVTDDSSRVGSFTLSFDCSGYGDGSWLLSSFELHYSSRVIMDNLPDGVLQQFGNTAQISEVSTTAYQNVIKGGLQKKLFWNNEGGFKGAQPFFTEMSFRDTDVEHRDVGYIDADGRAQVGKRSIILYSLKILEPGEDVIELTDTLPAGTKLVVPVGDHNSDLSPQLMEADTWGSLKEPICMLEAGNQFWIEQRGDQQVVHFRFTRNVDFKEDELNVDDQGMKHLTLCYCVDITEDPRLQQLESMDNQLDYENLAEFSGSSAVAKVTLLRSEAKDLYKSGVDLNAGIGQVTEPKVNFGILANPTGRHVGSGATFDIVDTMTPMQGVSPQVDLESLTVYRYVFSAQNGINLKGAPAKSEIPELIKQGMLFPVNKNLYTVKYTPGEHPTMTITVDNDSAYYISYDVNMLVDSKVATPSVSNTVSVAGLEAATADLSFRAKSSSATAGQGSVTLLKLDDGTNLPLAGAGFEMSAYDPNSSSWVASTQEDTDANGRIYADVNATRPSGATFVNAPDKDSRVTLYPDVLYRYHEHQPPTGYTAKEDVMRYFFFYRDDETKEEAFRTATGAVGDTGSIITSNVQHTDNDVPVTLSLDGREGTVQVNALRQNDNVVIPYYNTPATLTVVKVWMNGNRDLSTLPEEQLTPGERDAMTEVRLQLYRKKASASDDQYVPFGSPIALNSTNQWTESIDLTDDGYVYKAEELTTGSFNTEIRGNGTENGRIVVVNQLDLLELPVVKLWENDNQADRPDEIILTLKRKIDGQVDQAWSETVKLTAVANWSNTIRDLPRVDAAGNVYSYFLEEHSVIGYSSSIMPQEIAGSSVDGRGFTVTNTAISGAESRITVQKVLSGTLPQGAPTPKFDFLLEPVNNAPMPDQQMVSVNGQGTVTFGAVQYDLAGDYVYIVSEQNTQYSGIIYDNTRYQVTVSVTNDPAKPGKLKAEQRIQKLGDVITDADVVRFENTFALTPSDYALTVHKIFKDNTPRPSEKSFTVELTPVIIDGMRPPMPQKNGQEQTRLQVTGGAMASFESIRFTEAGSYQYTLQELEPTDAGYIAGYDSAVKNITITVSKDPNSMALQSVLTVGDNHEGHVDFTNDYQPVPTRLQFQAAKVVDDNASQQKHSHDSISFQFLLKDANTGAEIETVTLNPTGDHVDGTCGTVAFTPLEYTEAGEYRYTLQEVAGKLNGYAYDSSIRELVVTVQDNNGQLEASYTVDKVPGAAPSGVATPVTFTNQYSFSNASVSLQVEKEVSARFAPKTPQAFHFTLTGKNGNEPLPGNSTVTAQGTQSISFDPIMFTSAGTYVYTLQEEIPAVVPTGYTYSQAAYEVQITVDTTANGLQAKTEYLLVKDDAGVEVNAAAQSLRFVNRYAPLSTTLQFVVGKKVNDEQSDVKHSHDNPVSFTFQLADHQKGATSTRTVTDTGLLPGSDLCGLASFDSITFDAPGTYTYSLVELRGGESGYTYDTVPKAIEVVAEDVNGQITLKCSVDKQEKRITGNRQTEPIVITNTYTANSTTVNLAVVKILSGVTPPSNQRFQFRLTQTDGAAALPDRTLAEVEGAGTADFGAIRFTAPGVYEYDIEEVRPANMPEGYSYSRQKYHVVIQVTQDTSKLDYTLIAADVTYRMVQDFDGNAVTDGLQQQNRVWFENRYQPQPVSIQFPVRKAVDDQGSNRKHSHDNVPFQFRLRNLGDGTEETIMVQPAGDDTNGYCGQALSSEMTFAKAGQYSYQLQELNGGIPGYTYVTAPKSIVVNVTDIGGKFEVEYTVDNVPGTLQNGIADPVTFTNLYSYNQPSVQLGVEKRLHAPVSAPVKAQAFAFVLAGKNGQEPLPAPNTLTLTGASGGNFAPITFTAPGTYTYTVEEEHPNVIPAGYTYSQQQYQVEIQVVETAAGLQADPAVITLVRTEDGIQVSQIVDAMTFTNGYTPVPATLVIPVEKQVLGNARPNGEGQFNFSMTTSANAPLPQGNVTSLVVAGESKESFPAISFSAPGIYSYTIHEAQPQAPYASEDPQLFQRLDVTVSDANGQLQLTAELDGAAVNLIGNGSAYTAENLVYTNRYTPAEAHYELPVQKNIAGKPVREYSFRFTMIPVEGASTIEGQPNQTAPALEGSDALELTVAPQYGSAVDNFSHMHLHKAGSYVYTVREVDPRNLDGFRYGYDSAPRIVTIHVVDRDGALVVESVTSSVNGRESQVTNAAPLHFENAYRPTVGKAELKIHKTVTGHPRPEGKTESFAFTLRNIDDFDAPMPQGSIGKQFGVSIQGQGQQILEMPVESVGTYHYEIRETNGKAMGYTYDSNIYLLTLEVYDDNGVLKTRSTLKLRNADGTDGIEIAGGVASFSNRYNPTPAEFRLTVDKVMQTQHALYAQNPDFNKFRFILQPELITTPMPEDGTQYPDAGAGGLPEAAITIDAADGDHLSQQFAAIAYTSAGTYNYILREEVKPNAPYFSFDRSEHHIAVTVEDHDGNLEITSITDTPHRYNADGQLVEGTQEPYAGSVAFTNGYAPQATEVTLTASKKVEGSPRPNGEKDFTFRLSAEQADQPLPGVTELTLQGNTSAEFRPIHFDKAGTYSYTLSEKKDDLHPGYEYGEAVHFAIVVTDIGGRLEAKLKLCETVQDDFVLEITNTYTPKPIRLQIPVEKLIKGAVPQGKEKTFRFRMTGKQIGAQEQLISIDMRQDPHTAQFVLDFSQAGSYSYQISEVDDKLPGYTYSTDVHTLDVDVTDVNAVLLAGLRVDGNAIRTVEVPNSANEAVVRMDEPLRFENSYDAKPVTVEPVIQKQLTGTRRMKQSEFGFEMRDKDGKLVNIGENAGASKRNETVLVNFEKSLRFDAVGELSFFITERSGNLARVTYDKSRFRMDVSITDPGDGQLEAEVHYFKQNASGKYEPVEEVVFHNSYASLIPSTGYGVNHNWIAYGLLAVATVASILLVIIHRKRKAH